MGHSFFNGVIEVFGREGNTLYHIHQTTCDQVSNPWEPCTWELEFHQLGGELVSDPKNPLSVTNNIHLGLEVTLEILVVFILHVSKGICCKYEGWTFVSHMATGERERLVFMERSRWICFREHIFISTLCCNRSIWLVGCLWSKN